MHLRNNFYKILSFCGIILLLFQESKVPLIVIFCGIIINEFLVNWVKKKQENIK